MIVFKNGGVKDGDINYVEPDISVICDLSKSDEKRYSGAVLEGDSYEW